MRVIWFISLYDLVRPRKGPWRGKTSQVRKNWMLKVKGSEEFSKSKTNIFSPPQHFNTSFQVQTWYLLLDICFREDTWPWLLWGASSFWVNVNEPVTMNLNSWGPSLPCIGSSLETWELRTAISPRVNLSDLSQKQRVIQGLQK